MRPFRFVKALRVRSDREEVSAAINADHILMMEVVGKGELWGIMATLNNVDQTVVWLTWDDGTGAWDNAKSADLAMKDIIDRMNRD